MKFQDNLKMSYLGLTTHMSRSVLTILGIVIGITAIIIVMALGQSAQNLIVGQIEGLGPNNIFVIPGKQPTGPTSAGGTLLNDSIKNKDLEDLKKKSNVPDATVVVPIVFTQTSVSYESETYDAMILGGTEDVMRIYSLEVSQGNSITDEDVLEKSSNIILGQKIVDKLFGSSPVIGENVKIKDRNYRVVGVLAKKGQSPFVDFDEAVLMPYTTAQQYIMGIKYVQRVVIQAKSVDAIPGVIKDVTMLLRTNHKITDPANDDFFIQTQADLLKTISTVTDVLTIFLGSVAAISLIVGGIGIMNIMFVSVTERTREIGLRKSLGATNKNILAQFLTEAVILTVTGGVIGIILGISLTAITVVVLNEFAGINFAFSFPIVGALLGLLVSSAVGFIFGIFPARKASLKSPIEALRYE